MNENTHTYHRYYREGILAAISAGFFFILIGMILVARPPSLYDNLRKFFSTDSWQNTTTIGSTNVTIPVPKDPGSYTDIYNIAFEFCMAWGIFQILILVLRFIGNSSPRRKAQTISSPVFWFGAAYLINTYLNATTTQKTWLIFWAAIVVLIGVTLIVRAIARAFLK